jgi:Uma2 family endonuclease
MNPDEQAAAPPAEAGPDNGAADWVVPPEVVPNLDELVIEDDAPMGSIFTEKQQRLLTEPLYNSWAGPGEQRPFLALANVGLFYSSRQPPLVPDAMLSVDVELGADLSQRENRSYFMWIIEKPPDVVVEIVSDRRGGEEDLKMRQYARMRVLDYVIFDPDNRLGHGPLRSFVLNRQKYEPLTEHWFPEVNLGLTLWEGVYEGQRGRWLRWCDRAGVVIPTGREFAELQRQRAEQERQRAERLEAQLRALGVEPTNGPP